MILSALRSPIRSALSSAIRSALSPGFGAPTDYATTWNFYKGDAELAKTPWAARSRTTPAYRVNASGLLESTASPRLEHNPATLIARGLMVEGSESQLLLATEDLPSASWTKVNTPTIVGNVAVAPDGTTTADSIQNTSGVAFRYASQTRAVLPNSTVTVSALVKKEASETEYGGFALDFQGGTRRLCYIGVSAVTGAWGVLAGSTLTASVVSEDFGAYWRFSATVTDNGSNTSASTYYYSNISTNLSNLTTAGPGSPRTVWGLNLVVRNYLSSYIRGAAVSPSTRDADDWLIDGSDFTPTYAPNSFTWFADVQLDTVGTVFCLSDGTATNQVLARVTASTVDLVAGGATLASASRAFTPGRMKIAVSGDTLETVLAVNGSTYAGAAVPGGIRAAIDRGSICAVDGATPAATGRRIYRSAYGIPTKKEVSALAAETTFS